MAIYQKIFSKIFLVFAAIFLVILGFSLEDNAISQANGTCGPDAISVSRSINLSDIKESNFGGQYSKLPLKPFEVVLTFDDGPSPIATENILKTLENECTKATFFMLGEKIKENPLLAQAVLSKGHTIGLHSWSHIAMPLLNESEQVQDFKETEEIATQVLGHRPNLFRYPFLQDSKSLNNYLNTNGVNIISVDAIGYDWLENASVKSVHKTIFSQLEMNNNSGIILLHDNRQLAADVLPSLLKALKQKGYKIVAFEGLK